MYLIIAYHLFIKNLLWFIYLHEYFNMLFSISHQTVITHSLEIYSKQIGTKTVLTIKRKK